MNGFMEINGTRIELPESVIKQAAKALSITDEIKEFAGIAAETEFYHVISGKEPAIEVINNLRILYVYLPPNNGVWCYSVWKAAERFCKHNSDRWPCFEDRV